MNHSKEVTSNRVPIYFFPLSICKVKVGGSGGAVVRALDFKVKICFELETLGEIVLPCILNLLIPISLMIQVLYAPYYGLV